MNKMDKDKLIKFSDYKLDHIEWGCRKHNMNKIWLNDTYAICLQCSVELIGFKKVSDLLKNAKYIR